MTWEEAATANQDDTHGSAEDAGTRPEATRPPMPRWVKVSAIVVGTLLVLFVILHN